ncbi:MAG: hypothetical protein ACXU9D_12010 [Xanthobacteraceae bacterium]
MMGTNLAPIVHGNIDDGEAGLRQPLVYPLARLDIAGRNQQPRNFMQARIVADNEKAADGRIVLSDNGEDDIGTAFVKTVAALRRQGASLKSPDR